MNPVGNVHPAAFIGLLVLQHLTLYHTQLHQLPSFQHIGHSLISVGVSKSVNYKGNNAQEFTYLRKMKYLGMNYNGLTCTLLGLNLIANTLLTLDLDSNAIQSLTSMEGVKFIKLYRLDLTENNITHLRPEFLITPHLQFLHLESNKLVSLADVTQYSWGSSLPKQRYLEINLRRNPWHCSGSLIWIHNHLYKLRYNTIYTNPPRKPFITNVHQLFCQSPDSRRGTTVVPRDIISSIDVSIRSLRDLAGEIWWRHQMEPFSALPALCAGNQPTTCEFP